MRKSVVGVVILAALLFTGLPIATVKSVTPPHKSYRLAPNGTFENTAWGITSTEVASLRNVEHVEDEPDLYRDNAATAFGFPAKGIMLRFSPGERLAAVVIAMDATQVGVMGLQAHLTDVYGDPTVILTQKGEQLLSWTTPTSTVYLEAARDHNGQRAITLALVSRFVDLYDDPPVGTEIDL